MTVKRKKKLKYAYIYVIYRVFEKFSEKLKYDGLLGLKDMQSEYRHSAWNEILHDTTKNKSSKSR